MNDSQLLKGILEGCVLALISRGETYGYEIITRLEEYGFSDISEGTLYPVLTRLEKNGDIHCRKVKSPFGPTRKYYSITEAGKKTLDEFKRNYLSVVKSADAIILEKEENK